MTLIGSIYSGEARGACCYFAVCFSSAAVGVALVVSGFWPRAAGGLACAGSEVKGH